MFRENVEPKREIPVIECSDYYVPEKVMCTFLRIDVHNHGPIFFILLLRAENFLRTTTPKSTSFFFLCTETECKNVVVMVTY